MIWFMILISIMLLLLGIWSLITIYILWRAWKGLFGKEKNDGK